MRVDFLIVGQGLAGSLLAWTLLQRGCSVFVVDDGSRNASQVAAGIVNPVTGMRLAKTSGIDGLLPAAIECYSKLSSFFGRPFFIGKPMFRLLRSDAERLQALKRQQQPEYAGYIGDISPNAPSLPGFDAPYGVLEQKLCGHLLTTPLLTCLKNYFEALNIFTISQIDYENFHLGAKVSWQGITAEQTVFCEGYRMSNNPWFNQLPLQPVKGEIVTLHQTKPLPNAIVNYGHWLLPGDDETFRIGATFDRLNTGLDITHQGKSALLNALEAVNPDLACSPLVRQEAGIRPCSADRYPLIGRHPNPALDRLSVFNGFGAKGSLQIPWYGERFADYLLTHRSLPADCDIRRFETSAITS